MKYFTISMATLFCLTAAAQDSLPFQSIEDTPNEMSMGNIMARMIDGLGFRYYWATEGLRQEDLIFQFSDSSRTAEETLTHLLGLSNFVATVANGEALVLPRNTEELSWEDMRAKTLANLKESREKFASSDQATFDELVIVFQRGENTSELPFWNLLNGPLADAIYHVGQIVASRRASGNPIDPGVNVLMGTKQ